MRIVISSGHGEHVRGASQFLDERDENVRVTDRTAEILRGMGHDVKTFHDQKSTTQDANLAAICKFHNDQERDLDIAVHFNSSDPPTSKPRGTEVWYISQDDLAAQVSRSIADAAGWPDRGAKYTSSLYFLNNTEMPALLAEIAFVDSSFDAERYEERFEQICSAFAVGIVGDAAPVAPPVGVVVFTGKMSTFGGPQDTGVDPDEGLAMYVSVDEQPNIFLEYQPSGTTGLARRLNPASFYVACPWEYNITSKAYLRTVMAKVTAMGSDGRNRFQMAYVGDYGPHGDTGRSSDLSPGLAAALGLVTDDICTVEVPLPPAVA
jgi:N-acetylmuramoyl-L-alanine amidase